MKTFITHYIINQNKKHKELTIKFLADDIKSAKNIAYQKILLKLETLEGIKVLQVLDTYELNPIRPERSEQIANFNPDNEITPIHNRPTSTMLHNYNETIMQDNDI